MRELTVHLVWLGTHILRTFVASDSTWSAVEKLSQEVKELQAELHRAHRLVEGYSSLLQKQEQGSNLLHLFVQGILCGSAALGLFWIWYISPRRRATSLQTGALSIGDTGGSSSESDSQCVVQPIRSSGPARPSTLGKGRRKL